MYEDSWYSFVPDVHGKQDVSHLQKTQHRRRESLLKQPTDGGNPMIGHIDPLVGLYQESTPIKNPPKADVARRAKSYSDFYHVARAQIMKESKRAKSKNGDEDFREAYKRRGLDFENIYDTLEVELLEANQEEFRIYKDQLALSKRHLDGLLQDTTTALDLLANLSDSFKSVEAQTTAFQAQCEDLLEEQKHIRTLSEQVQTGLQYYAYLEPITRRLNAPGASSVIGDDGFVGILTNLDACIEFMSKHPEHRESEIYLTRYKSLLARTMSLITNIFANSIKDSVTGATNAEAMRRKEAGKLTMTSIYLLQDPQSAAELDRLRDTITYITEQSKKAIDSSDQKSRQDKSSVEQEMFSSHVHIYDEGINAMIQEYINTRKSTIPSIVETYLTQTLPTVVEPGVDFPRYARECLTATLEICENETHKFERIFGANFDNSKFKDYQMAIASRVFDLLEQRLRSMDISEAVEMAAWLNNHVSHRNTTDDLASMQSDEEQEDELNATIYQTKSTVAQTVNSKLITSIFGRMREILLKDIERYVSKPEDFVPGTTSIQADLARDSTSLRLEKALGLAIQSAYPPVKTACRLLVLVHDLSYDFNGENDSNEIAYEILHQTCVAITRGAYTLAHVQPQIDGRLFSIKNLFLLKNLVLAYEISGSHRVSALDFTDLWATFAELRVRGAFFDIAAYYNLLRSGNLLPKIVQNVQDARIELDGLLRENITKFREDCAGMMVMSQVRGTRETTTAEEEIKGKLMANFPHDEQLRDGLWDAVQLLIDGQRGH